MQIVLPTSTKSTIVDIRVICMLINVFVSVSQYFLVGIEKTARKASNTLSEVLLLKQQLESQIHQNWGRRVQSALTLLNVLFQDPFVNVKDVEAICNLSPKAAGSLIQSFEDSGILKEFTGQSRNRMFVFEEYLGLFK